MVRREEPPKKYSTTINPEINERKCCNCGETVFKRFYSKQEGKFVTSTMPFTCSYCGKEFCVDCHIPEKHRCAGGVTNNKWFEKEVPSYRKPFVEIHLDDDFKQLEEDSSVNVQSNDTAINKVDENNSDVNSPPKVEEKYRSESVGTTIHNEQDIHIRTINWPAVIILLIIISSSLYFVIGNSNSQNTNRVTPSNFSNDNAEKVTNPIPIPKDIFDKINEYREQNKKYKILWSDDAYRLADFRASDMVKRNYFSHTTSDGKTVSDYIGKYNFFSDSAWGENLCKGCSDPIQTWIGSADDRKVLLGGWGKGAVACESDICVFIGVNE